MNEPRLREYFARMNREARIRIKPVLEPTSTHLPELLDLATPEQIERVIRMRRSESCPVQ